MLVSKKMPFLGAGSVFAFLIKGSEIFSFAEADEAEVYIKGSKTDQYNAECVRNHYRLGGDVCPVAVLAKLQLTYPERWTSESHLPLYCSKNCRMLDRARLAKMIKEAGLVVGLDPDKMDVHSLRIGGATAMYAGSGEYK